MQDWSDSFNYVELDITLEKSIQRASKSQGGIVGQTRMFVVVVEFGLISHEILLIQNNCRKLTNERMMEHHKPIMYQELRSIKAVILLCQCLPSDCITSLAHNDEILDVFENGEKIQTRELILKTKKIAVKNTQV